MMNPWQIYRSLGWSMKRIAKTVNDNRPRNWVRYWSQKRAYLATGTQERIIHTPCIDDWCSHTPIDPVYYYQDAWAFERIVEFGPERHIDVGSHHKMVALLSKVVPTTTVDIRPFKLTLDSLDFVEGSILDLPFDDGSCKSVSSICVVEHIGLGRYGDPIDKDGSLKAAKELIRVLAEGGHLFVSVPLAPENRVQFNAHRAFTEETVLRMFHPLLPVQKRYIYGESFVTQLENRIGTGCYEFVHVKRHPKQGNP